ncbi:MAG: tRNA lysidine(34) synthetase TilS [Deltaproteobacteria bacterium]|nr:MAG: tRNA lysidine(34) synthetase TilS [Deltaproteobacteria bacterium]HEX16193.1 tRNA lysidine(34) synthetase TilS [Deltaproteobacteria bacterium]
MVKVERKVREIIDEFQMLRGGETVGVAVSGGVDSVVLLDLLKGLAKDLKLELVVLHLEHGIRGEEARRDEAFVRDLARREGLPFHFRRVDTPRHARERGLSLEEAARELRYAFFESAAKELGLERIALGHTADDQVETVIMAFLRGAGLRGLKGIPPVRGIYIRPMLRLWRREVQEYAAERGLPFVVDSSNLDPSYLRNRIRHEVLPMLEGINPRIRERLLEMAEVLREEDEALQEVSHREKERLCRRDGPGWRLQVEELLRLPKGLRSRVLTEVFQDLAKVPLPYRHHQALKDVVEGKKRGVQLPKGLVALREGGEIYLGPEPKGTQIEERVLVVPGVTVLEGGELEIEAEERQGPPAGTPSPDVAYLDRDKLHLPLRVRSARQGDRFVPLGLGGTKKLQDFFVDEKVPRSKRSLVPVVLTGDEICWVAGMRVDERFRATPETKRTLILRLKRARR